MRIVSTADVSLDDLERFAADLGTDFEPEVDSGQVFLRSTDPPSFIVLLQEAAWWQQLLAASATLFAAEFVKEAAKASWRNKGAVIPAVKEASSRLFKLADAIASLRSQQSAVTQLNIGLPIPNNYFSTKLSLEGTETEIIAAQLALFVHHLPALSDYIAKSGLNERTVATGMFLELRDDGSLKLTWYDRATSQPKQHVLEIESPKVGGSPA